LHPDLGGERMRAEFGVARGDLRSLSKRGVLVAARAY
jgi:hypothetical protein